MTSGGTKPRAARAKVTGPPWTTRPPPLTGTGIIQPGSSVAGSQPRYPRVSARYYSAACSTAPRPDGRPAAVLMPPAWVQAPDNRVSRPSARLRPVSPASHDSGVITSTEAATPLSACPLTTLPGTYSELVRGTVHGGPLRPECPDHVVIFAEVASPHGSGRAASRIRQKIPTRQNMPFCVPPTDGAGRMSPILGRYVAQ